MICKKAMKIAMGVGMVLCATASFAGVTENFEGTIGTGWSDGTAAAVVEDNSQYGGEVGCPISGDHTKILNVEGEVSCTNSPEGTPTSSISDFLIFIPEPSDELDDEGLTDAKIAIAAGTTESNGIVPLCLYCTTNGTNKGWGVIGSVSTGTWVRVTLAFTNGFCRVSIDGEPAKSSFGYTAASDSAAPTGTSTGAWYKLAGTGNSVQSLSFIGCAKLDDVVIKDSFAEDAFPATAVAKLTDKNEEVSYNNLNKWGMTVNDVLTNWGTVLNETSGMTVGQKIACGYDPNSATKFEPVSITKEAADKAKIKFPIESTDELGRYKVVLAGGKAGENTEVGGAADAGGGLAEINLSNLTYNQGSTVIKFTLKAEKPSEE